jgi:NAD+ synthase
MPIGDLYKSELRELAKFLQIPSDITTKKSSARLWKGQTTEGEIGLAYDKIDSILKQIDNSDKRKKNTNHLEYLDIPLTAIKKYKLGNGQKDVQRLLDLINKSEHKLAPPPICRIG